MPEPQIAELLQSRGAKLRRTRKGRVHTVDFRDAPGVSDDEILPLTQLERLTELCLAGTAITDATVARLTPLARLETLDLENTAVTDAALASLAQLPQLKLLVLRGTRVSREAVAELRKRMIGTRIVT
jgi:hypothetical protein